MQLYLELDDIVPLLFIGLSLWGTVWKMAGEIMGLGSEKKVGFFNCEGDHCLLDSNIYTRKT